MSRRPSAWALTALVMAACLALGAAGCGDDQSPQVTVPTITAPENATQTAAPTTATEPGQPTTGAGNGGSGDTGAVDPNAEDSVTNDKPPPPGSPAEAFEKACEANPAACGY